MDKIAKLLKRMMDATLKKVSPDREETESFTKITYKHVPSGLAYYIQCFDEAVFPGKLEQYSIQKEGEDVAQVFVERLLRDIKRLAKILRALPIKMTVEDEEAHR